MEFFPQSPVRSNSNPTYHNLFECNATSNMYSQHLKFASNNMSSLGKMHYSKQSLSDGDISPAMVDLETKKPSPGILKSIMNYLGELIRPPNIFNTLSVTINPNNDVITPDFFTNMHHRIDDRMGNSDFNKRRWSDESPGYQNSMYNFLHDMNAKENHISCDKSIEEELRNFCYNYSFKNVGATEKEDVIIDDNKDCKTTDMTNKDLELDTAASFANTIEEVEKPILGSAKARTKGKSRRPSLIISRKKINNRNRSRPRPKNSELSQKQHRKQSGKRQLMEDIRDDIDDLFELGWFEEKYESQVNGACDSNNSKIEKDRQNVDIKTSNTTKKKQKRKKKKADFNETKVGEMTNIVMTLNVARSLSESSIDSEDSFCIIFEEAEDDSDLDSICFLDSDDESDDDNQSTPNHVATKIRFSSNDTSYEVPAYCESRKGPWEEMARDRERLGRKIEAVLTQEHRHNVWQQRFKDFDY